MQNRFLNTDIVVRWRFEYVHRWPAAENYLQHPHRHVLHCQVTMTQWADRAIEFIELKRELEELCTALMVGHPYVIRAGFAEPFVQIVKQTASMEAWAFVLAELLAEKYGEDRFITVTVLEDGENGAVYTHLPVPGGLFAEVTESVEEREFEWT